MHVVRFDCKKGVCVWCYLFFVLVNYWLCCVWLGSRLGSAGVRDGGCSLFHAAFGSAGFAFRLGISGDGRSPDLLRLQFSSVVCTLLPVDCEILISAIIGGVIGGVLRVQFCGAYLLNSMGS